MYRVSQKKEETSTNHFSVKLRSLLFTIYFDFMTLTLVILNKKDQRVTKCHKVSQSVTKFTKHSFRDGVGGGGEW